MGHYYIALNCKSAIKVKTKVKKADKFVNSDVKLSYLFWKLGTGRVPE
jgi:hypothetical protein